MWIVAPIEPFDANKLYVMAINIWTISMWKVKYQHNYCKMRWNESPNRF